MIVMYTFCRWMVLIVAYWMIGSLENTKWQRDHDFLLTHARSVFITVSFSRLENKYGVNYTLSGFRLINILVTLNKATTLSPNISYNMETNLKHFFYNVFINMQYSSDITVYYQLLAYSLNH